MIGFFLRLSFLLLVSQMAFAAHHNVKLDVYCTRQSAEVGSGLNQMRYVIRPYYRLIPGLSLFTEYEHEQDYGAFKAIQRNNNE